MRYVHRQTNPSRETPARTTSYALVPTQFAAGPSAGTGWLHHIVEVALGANLADIEPLAVRGSIPPAPPPRNRPASRSGGCSSKTSAWISWARRTSRPPTRQLLRARSTTRRLRDGAG